MPARAISSRAAVHLHQCLAPGCSGRAPTDRTRPPSPWPGTAQWRLFHGTRLLRGDNDQKNHYETLNVQTNASAAEIKKSFYSLSKIHHPDHNRDDPRASRRFTRISEAYTTLSHTTSRTKYDRDVLRLHEKRAHAPHHRGGSYHSAGPAGGRPASGLSRRRGTFRGPPPSFFRSGGWGAHGAKRSAAHEESTGGGGSAQSEKKADDNAYTAYSAGGMGPGQEPLGRGSAAGEVPHFDRGAKAAHTRTQDRVDEMRARARRSRKEGGFAFPSAVSDFNGVGSFFAIMAVLGAAVAVPALVINVLSSSGPKKKRAKG